MNRNLDGCYFRLERDGRWQSICFSDLTDQEMMHVLDDRGIAFIQSLAIHLAHRLKAVGDAYDLRGE